MVAMKSYLLHKNDHICPAILKTVCGMLKTNIITILGFYFTKKIHKLMETDKAVIT